MKLTVDIWIWLESEGVKGFAAIPVRRHTFGKDMSVRSKEAIIPVSFNSPLITDKMLFGIQFRTYEIQRLSVRSQHRRAVRITLYVKLQTFLIPLTYKFLLVDRNIIRVTRFRVNAEPRTATLAGPQLYDTTLAILGRSIEVSMCNVRSTAVCRIL